MTVAGETSATPRQKPQPLQRLRARPVPRTELIWQTGEQAATAWQRWTRELLECRPLILLASVLALVALYADYRCGVYVTAMPGAKVPDLILDRLPSIDLSFLFIYGYMALLVGLFCYPLLFRVRMLHAVIFQFSLLLILRSLFMLFTHLETPAGSVPVHFPGIFSNLYFENDMFFSGHTAMPFLGFYLFRPSRFRYVFLVGALVMGVVVLAMHVHYSIDVLAAFFMTYCSYQMGNRVLSKIDPTFGSRD